MSLEFKFAIWRRFLAENNTATQQMVNGRAGGSIAFDILWRHSYKSQEKASKITPRRKIFKFSAHDLSRRGT